MSHHHHHHHASLLVAYILWFFLGLLGIHRFYLGRTISGIVYLFTGGIFGIGWLVDIFLLPSLVRHYNNKHHDHTTVIVAPAPVVYQAGSQHYAPYQPQPYYAQQPISPQQQQYYQQPYQPQPYQPQPPSYQP
ncbi:hypothetical protein DICPUDRAFT_33672 [Dictyostelium purpureum]|uniref:TM2 domain-containing protein n=1 Tax=Dictyostelium purpureum TaxID=5786 RepID=F0ZLA3_DICPU|nr:uncharacterized protein DICPUDRAFT_33672 [Dictyostelium purpureum]EGC35266.1 hypothetical protein DICPUDRAFT_33672 [Dictyostelium purpureum]|eukprot:XP_003288192.1 hypothetical protein DICPUDRAFT_33672 [Dictyostelium purpureum]